MGNLIFDCIGKKGYERLSNADKFRSLLDIPARTLLKSEDAPKTLGEYCQGKKAILCVNVASNWGLTAKNYKELVQMDKELPELQILAFPCNQFGGQEPKSPEEIAAFVKEKGVEFPLF